MKRITMHLIGAAAIVAGAFGFSACDNKSQELESKIASMETDLKKAADEKATTATYLTRFDSLDFEVYSKQRWDHLSDSHDENIKVNWPDGHSTTGLAQHIEDLKGMFVFAPNTKIDAHPVRFGSGEWTCVTGTMSGTFSKPMPLANGKSIPPTGKSFNLPMCTVGHWKDGKMIEESLYWDNGAFMKQIGLAK